MLDDKTRTGKRRRAWAVASTNCAVGSSRRNEQWRLAVARQDLNEAHRHKVAAHRLLMKSYAAEGRAIARRRHHDRRVTGRRDCRSVTASLTRAASSAKRRETRSG